MPAGTTALTHKIRDQECQRHDGKDKQVGLELERTLRLLVDDGIGAEDVGRLIEPGDSIRLDMVTVPVGLEFPLRLRQSFFRHGAKTSISLSPLVSKAEATLQILEGHRTRNWKMSQIHQAEWQIVPFLYLETSCFPSVPPPDGEKSGESWEEEYRRIGGQPEVNRSRFYIEGRLNDHKQRLSFGAGPGQDIWSIQRDRALGDLDFRCRIKYVVAPCDFRSAARQSGICLASAGDRQTGHVVIILGNEPCLKRAAQVTGCAPATDVHRVL
jgi:hypothetical protein